MLIIFLLSSQPELPGLGQSLDRLIQALGHMLGYGVLARLWVGPLKRQGLTPTGVLWGSLLLALLYALLDEWHQSFVAGRRADPADLALDSLGSGVALMGWACCGRRSRSR